jgi:excisionase family DNA binding protein
MSTQLMSYHDVAERLGVTTAVVRKWVERKMIPHLRLGERTVRFREDEIDAWVAARAVAPVAAGGDTP